MKEIAPGIFIETGYALVTVGAILTDSGWVCIDTPPYPRDARAWKSALQALGDLPVRYVINTDHHRDRILGNAWFDAPVVAHEASAEVILNLKNGFTSQSAEELSSDDDDELAEIASLRIVPPQISYTHSMRLNCGKRVIILTHHPSATAGNTWVTLPDEKFIFVGDTVVIDQHPHVTEGLSRPWLDSLSSLRQDQYADWTLVSGRGDVISPSATESLSNYLRTAREQVESLLGAERPRSETLALIPDFLPLFDYEPEQREEVQRRIKAMLEAFYEELRASQEKETSAE
ncbi:MAG: MBL fold metallo-hydrolase [Anaerolineae bacterium]|nr:MBL fold metallo-hydrolase [Anaerolineae bacterium]